MCVWERESQISCMRHESGLQDLGAYWSEHNGMQWVESSYHHSPL